MAIFLSIDFGKSGRHGRLKLERFHEAEKALLVLRFKRRHGAGLDGSDATREDGGRAVARLLGRVRGSDGGGMRGRIERAAATGSGST